MRRLSLLASVLLCLSVLAPVASAQRYVGSISLVPYNFAPNGSALCNGQLMPISENEVLFNLIGTTYGGDGQSTFALPDLRGRVALGEGTDPSTGSTFVIGQQAGEENVTLTVSQIPQHTHTALASGGPGNTVSPTNAYWAPGPRVLLYSAATNLTPMNPESVKAAGSSQPHDNMKPYLTLNYVIWLFGIFPTQN